MMRGKGCISFDSYIKPQLVTGCCKKYKSCISFDSYIKPQHPLLPQPPRRVVYLLIPTSNHNLSYSCLAVVYVVYLLIPTSNHNPMTSKTERNSVVYLLIPTSNHNCYLVMKVTRKLYIF